MNDLEYIKSLKDNIDNAKAEKARHEGSLETLYATLKKDFDVETIEEAIHLLGEMEEKMANKEKRMNRAISTLKTKMDELDV